MPLAWIRRVLPDERIEHAIGTGTDAYGPHYPVAPD